MVQKTPTFIDEKPSRIASGLPSHWYARTGETPGQGHAAEAVISS